MLEEFKESKIYTFEDYFLPSWSKAHHKTTTRQITRLIVLELLLCKQNVNLALNIAGVYTNKGVNTSLFERQINV